VSDRRPGVDFGGAIGAIAKGMGTVLKQVFRRDVTEQYPSEIVQPPPRSHIGRHLLNRHENGLEKCIGCELCAYACPADAIWVVGEDNDPENPTLTSAYEMSFFSREEAILTKEQLLEPPLPLGTAPGTGEG
jgi:formate hydrogenlyase subunit 6/NADH:ubiquinone oxidoreductase subunit I